MSVYEAKYLGQTNIVALATCCIKEQYLDEIKFQIVKKMDVSLYSVFGTLDFIDVKLSFLVPPEFLEFHRRCLQ